MEAILNNKQTQEETFAIYPDEMLYPDEIQISPTFDNVKYRGSFRNYYLSDYSIKPKFLTTREEGFYKKLYDVLQKNTPKDQYIIFANVKVSDVIKSSSDQQFKTINPWHFDFVICDSLDLFKPVMVIELDDLSHEDPDVKKRDATKDQICEYINLPLKRIYGFSDDSIKDELKEVLILEDKA